MVDIEAVRRKIAAGESVICFTMVNGRSALANVVRVNEDGTSEYEIIGVCPRAPIFN